VNEYLAMPFKNQKQRASGRPTEARVPKGCPQYPEGGYDLIAGTRRNSLAQRLQETIFKFDRSGDLHNLLSSLQQLLKEGLPVADIDGLTVQVSGGKLRTACKLKLPDYGTIQVVVSQDEWEFSAEVLEKEIAPVEVSAITSCPLVGPEDYGVCNPDTCITIKQLQERLNAVTPSNSA